MKKVLDKSVYCHYGISCYYLFRSNVVIHFAWISKFKPITPLTHNQDLPSREDRLREPYTVDMGHARVLETCMFCHVGNSTHQLMNFSNVVCVIQLGLELATSILKPRQLNY